MTYVGVLGANPRKRVVAIETAKLGKASNELLSQGRVLVEKKYILNIQRDILPIMQFVKSERPLFEKGTILNEFFYTHTMLFGVHNL
jgi:hypothetical protein